MNRLKTGIASAALCTLLAVSCTHPISDDSLANSIKASLYSNQTTKPENIAVAVKNGVVTLSGDVSSPDSALEAMKIANATPGIRSVADQMTINGTSAAAQLPNAGSAEQTPPGTSTTALATATPAPSPTATAPPSQPQVATAPPASEAPAVPVAPPAPETPPAPPRPTTITIPAGEQVLIRTTDTIDSKQNQTGQTFPASLSSALVTEGHVIVPQGTSATIVLSDAKATGRFAGKGELEVRLSSITYRGKTYDVDSSVFTQSGDSRTKQTAVRTGIGAAAGAIIGALAGGGKGAAIGSAAGGGAGFGSDLFTHGPRVRIPAESVLTFRLESDLTIQR